MANITGLLAEQQAATTGYAADREREEKDLEEIAHGNYSGGRQDDQGWRAGTASPSGPRH